MVDETQTADADHAGHRTARPQQNKGEELDADGVDAVESGGALVDADRLDVETQGGKAEQQREENAHQDDDQNRRRDRNTGNEAADRGDDGTGDRRGGAAVDPVGNAAAAGEENQGRDHGLDVKDRNKASVECPEQHGDQTAHDESADDGERRDGAAALQHLDKNAAGNRGESADGDVLPAGCGGDQRHAHGENDQLRRAVENGDQVPLQDRVSVVVCGDADGEERGIPEQVENHQKQNRDQRDQQLGIVGPELAGSFILLFHLSSLLPRSSALRAPG